MRKSLILAGFCLGVIATAEAQERAFQTQQEWGGQLRADALIRQEWTRDIFVPPSGSRNEDRRRFQFRPRLEVSAPRLSFLLGGDFNYSTDNNLEPEPALLRDNYDSRHVRLDLAAVAFVPSESFQLQGGRFFMPVPFTEMIWDKDLRPQGGALTVRSLDAGGNTRFGVTVLGARGSHVFDDRKTGMLVASATFGAQPGPTSRIELTGSYIRYERPDSLARFIRRQNTLDANGGFTNDYSVIDVVGRLETGGSLPAQLTADYCVNLEADEGRTGLWLAAALGSLQSSALRAEYTFAKVDSDATLAAYATDDFFWSTGWQGHRLDLGTRAGRSSLHAIGQIQRFKDSPNPAVRDEWVKRFRVEVRYQ